MQTFELLLILVNLLSLLLLGFKKQSKAIWLGAVGLNIIMFIIHGIFEGVRYKWPFHIFLLFCLPFML